MADTKHLWEIRDAYRDFLENRLRVNEDGEIENIDELDALEGEFEDKAEATAVVIKEMMNDYDFYKHEADALKERADAIKNRAEKLKGYLARNMVLLEKKKIETEKCSIKTTHSSPVKILDQFLIPQDYLRVKVTKTEEPDKVKIKEAIKAGKTVPGAILEEKDSVTVK